MIDPVDIELLAKWFNDSVLIALMMLAQTTVQKQLVTNLHI